MAVTDRPAVLNREARALVSPRHLVLTVILQVVVVGVHAVEGGARRVRLVQVGEIVVNQVWERLG